jgi:NitT/TauT family transport system ATP-binding protein
MMDDRRGAGTVEFVDVTQVYPATSRRAALTALSGMSFTAEAGQFVAVVGPTGCGKSTMLTVASGLAAPSSGEVRIGGEPVRGLRRDLGFVFQQDALLPWKTALDNVQLPLKFRGVRRAEARERARDLLRRVGLADFEGSYPHQLSGGMRKRVAMAATMVYEPVVLLMDEPFSALDVQTRGLKENDLLRVWQELGHQTVLFITHDLEEAIGLADRVIVLSARPARIVADYRVDLPRPRDLLEVKLDPDFTELYRKIWADLEFEVLRVSGQETGGGPGAFRSAVSDR